MRTERQWFAAGLAELKERLCKASELWDTNPWAGKPAVPPPGQVNIEMLGMPPMRITQEEAAMRGARNEEEEDGEEEEEEGEEGGEAQEGPPSCFSRRKRPRISD